MARCGYCGTTDLGYVERNYNPKELQPHFKPKAPNEMSRRKCTGFGENYSGHLTASRSS